MAEDGKISAPVRKRANRATADVRAAAAARASEVSEEMEDEIEDRLASLGGQIAALTHQVEQFAEERWDDAREVAAGVEHAGALAARRAGRQTVAAARAVRDDPVPVMVGFGVLALLVAFILGQSSQRSR